MTDRARMKHQVSGSTMREGQINIRNKEALDEKGLMHSDADPSPTEN